MSDYYPVRSRRRPTDTPEFNSNSLNVDVDEHKKKYGNQALFPGYNPISTVFGASSAQLWNSAQEAFSSIHTSDFYSQNGYENTESATFEAVFPSLTIYGDPIDKLTFTMPSRDRTAEFKTTVKSYEMKVHANGHRPPGKQAMVAESVKFNNLAKQIGHDLSSTCAKMEKLAEMAKKKSLFDERSEIEHLSRVVKEDITSLNKQIGSLQEFSRVRNGGVKTQGTGHSQLVVVGLQSKLANVSKDFQSVLEISTENMKHQKNRREKFSQADPVPMSLPSSSSTPNVRSRLLADDANYGGGSVALDMGAMEQYRTQQQMTMRDQSHEYVQARSTAMETIEGSISELGQIFSQLASLVSEQGEMITRIDSNVEDTAINIDAAHTELVKYFHNISRNRWLILKVFGVLMAFFVVFILFLA